jgi:small subunit ribosomal protein S18
MSQAEDKEETSGEQVFGRSEGAEGEERPRRGARGRDRDRGDREAGGRRGAGGRMRRPRRKVCAFCVDKVKRIDYKDHQRLRDYVSDRGKILKSRMTGNCFKHQRKLAAAIKRARQVALLPFVAE